MNRLGFSPQAPARRVAERDEKAVETAQADQLEWTGPEHPGPTGRRGPLGSFPAAAWMRRPTPWSAHERNGRGDSAGGFRHAACCCKRLSQPDDSVRLRQAHSSSAVSGYPRIQRLGRTRQRGPRPWHGHGALQRAGPRPG
ncbi:hypothetical protein ABZU94_25715 [Streptomyces mirabilis]|uniref:hypothetical protein n=1 Tax=Streptomyces sp. NPDC005388 TaxID=3156717 RepID=UPI0033B8EC78